MIHLFTGLPGASKTLYMLGFVERQAKAWNKDEPPELQRPIYYNGIKELKLPGWIEFEDASKWYELPKGAFIVIDECQTEFRPRHVSREVPEAIAKMETHRHDGYDLFLITQHPGLIDSNVRKLVGLHFHSIRKWGAQASTVHEWQGVREQPAASGAKTESVKHHYVFDRSLYGKYKSAEVHTVQRRVPAKIYFLLLVPIAIAAAAIYIYNLYGKQAKPPAAKTTSSGQVSPGQVGTSTPASSSGAAKAAVVSTGEWLEAQAPRIPGLPATAPKYDKIMAPATAPRPAACVVWPKKGCRCYTQQATRISMDEPLCRQIVERGYFDDTLPDRPAQAPGIEQQQRGQAVQAPVPMGPGAGAAAPVQAPGQVLAQAGQVHQRIVPAASPWRFK